MRIREVPPYPGDVGKIGDRLYHWLLKIPVIGDILMSIFSRDTWFDKVIAEEDLGMLQYMATFGDNRLKEAAIAGIHERFPEATSTQSAIGTFLDNLQHNPSQAIGTALTGMFDNPIVKELTESTGALVFDSVMTMAIGGKEKLPLDLQDRIRRFLGTTVMLSAAPRVAGTITEITSLGQVDTLGEIMRDAYFNLGLGFVTWQMTSPLIDGGIGQELKHEANLIFRPQRFTWSQIRDLFSMGKLTRDQVIAELQRLGWRDEDIDHIVTLAYKSISEGTVLGMWTDGMIDDDEALRRIRESGYTFEDAALVMDYTRSTKVNAQKDVLLSTARKAFQTGLIAEDRFRGVLVELGYTEDAVDLEIAVSRLAMEEDERNLSASQLKTAFINNVITEVEALSGLQELRFRNDEAQILIETWKRGRAPKVLRVNKQTILQAWQRGVLSEIEARSKISEVGYPPEDVNLIIDTAKAEGAYLRPKASVGLLIEGVRSNVITVEILTTELHARQYSDLDITLITGIAKEQREVGLTSDSILDAFQADVITREKAQSKLIDLGVTIATASMLLDTREAERELRIPHVPLGVLMAMASEDLIRVDDLRTILRDRDFPEGDITIIVAAVLYEAPRELSQALIERSYKEGVVSRDEAVDRLVILGFTPTDANTILVTVEKEMAVSQPRASVTVYVGACRDGIISPGELRLKLERLGMIPEDVELFVTLATYYPAMPEKMLTKTDTLNAYEAFFFTRVDALRRLEMLGYALEDADVLIRMKRRDPQDSEVHTLYQADVLTFEQAAVSLFALGYTEEQIMYYFEHYGKGEVT